MSEKLDLKVLLSKLNECDMVLSEQDVDDAIEFDCQYNLLYGLKIKVPANERKKLSQWKDMARKVESTLESKRNERNKNLLEEIRKVELRMEKNRLQKTNSRDQSCMKVDKSSTGLEENEELPYVYKFHNNMIHSKMENSTPVSDQDSILAYEKLDDVNYFPELKKQMESLHVLQAQQKELDSWYGNMQKQLEIEKVRLSEKYEELQLRNIREQQSIIDSSHEFLRCASNNNTPCLANANGKPNIGNYVNNKNHTTSGSLKVVNSSLHKSKSPPIIQSSSLPIFKTTPNKMKSLEGECLTSDKNSLEYATPCASPDKNVSKKAFEDTVQVNGVKNYYSISTISTETSPENAVSMSSSQYDNDMVHEPVDEVIEIDLQNPVNCTYPVDVNEETVSCAKSLSIANGLSRLNLENDASKSLPVSLKRNEDISNAGNNYVDSINFNCNSYKENNNSIHSKSSIIPNERKTLISVPSRQTSIETLDSLELGRGSFDQLIKEHDFQKLESRRKSRPIKFFSNPFPEVIANGDYDDEVSLSTNTRQLVTHSPISSISLKQKQQQQEQEHCPLEQQQQQQQQQNQLYQERGDTYQVTTSPIKPNVSSNCPRNASPLRQHRLQQNPDQLIEHNNVSEDTSVSTHQFGNSKVNDASYVASNSLCMVSNGPGHHVTSTPEKFSETRGVGLLFEISAVKLHELDEGSKTPTHFTKNANPTLKAILKIQAAAKGFLTRRLLNTLKVQDIIKTIKDTEEFLNDINKENINNQKLADRQLRVRLQDELSTKRGKLHDIFFNMDPRDQMKMLAISRAQVEEKHRKKQAQMKPVRSNPAYSRNISSSAGSGNLSTASQKSIKRRQTNNVIEKVPKTTKSTTEKGINLKKMNKIESTGANIHVCIAGALKPIQSCTSPTIADRKKTKSPMKTNSVQNRYPKKSSVSKRLDMNAAVSNSQSGRFKSNVGLSTR